ncbi:calcium uniporter protein 2, mitochondrial-like [Iris pallida]|uniref:Calcium uniporter protein 2, mitochondrial-like n=1 Tax=Iris pallida TaxID=29817 RepID=A0AAX6G303_IRIPA|nr:calcium uniporter protein 2, mitochondrial-like [Iris pallida]
MAYRKTFAHRFLSIATVSSESCVPSVNNKPFLFKNQVLAGLRFSLQTAAVPYADRIPRVPTGDMLMDRIRDSIRLEGLYPPKKEERVCIKISVEEAKKVLRAWQVEEVRKKLRGMGSYISYPELVKVCCEVTGRYEPRSEIAQLLDNSGAVIILGNIVFLQPDLVAKAIEGVIPVPEKDLQRKRKELEAMEEKKVEIDRRAEAQVKRELWGGLGLISLQTAAFIRLTFWELSWDVMEPICFFVTSLYFIAGYAFFLRTSREPSFEGFFSSRFGMKQRSLMKAHNFDVEKLDELKRAYYGPSATPNSCSRVTND